MQELRLFDYTISRVQNRLQSRLPWLRHCYGRVERRKGERKVTVENAQYNGVRKQTFYYPHLYLGNGDYKNLMPSNEHEDMCFFYLDGRQTVKQYGRFPQVESTVNAVFWVDMRNIFGDDEGRYTENVKEEILMALNGCEGVRVDAIYEECEKVYEKFTYRDCVDFCMSPYYAVRFECTMAAEQGCVQTTPRRTGSFDDSYDDSYEKGGEA